MTYEVTVAETKVNLLAQQVQELQKTVDGLMARMSNLERSQERLAHYVGWQVNAVDEKEAIADSSS